MEKHRCKLCLKNFSNGRALGGHMRSHMLNLPIPPRQEEEEIGVEEEEQEQPPPPPPLPLPHNQLSGGDTESGSLSSSPTSDEEDEEGEEKLLGVCYGLRENPKRSFRLVDPEFSLAAAVDAGSIVLQDRESETESSKNPTRRRSKRTRKLDQQQHHHHQYQQQELQQENSLKKLKFHKATESSSWAHEPEPVSSISDTTTEEDVAFCLMMLSRDKWKRREQQKQQQQQQQRGRRRFVMEDEEQDEEADKSMEETDESDEFKSCNKNRSRGKYKCETCKKVFKSYQALGGHRASHKKIKFYNTNTTPPNNNKKPDLEQENAGTSGSTPASEKKNNKIHECPVCFRVFSSGQALGGHKRTHVTGQAAATTTTTTTTTSTAPVRTTTITHHHHHHHHHLSSSSTKFGDNLIDLNLPAPVDDDDISQIELSAVSDAEFVNHIKR